MEVLSKADDEELRYYLLQLVQALRYESGDDSQLASFIVNRAVKSIHLAVPLHWYLYTEWEDPTFGPRAGYVHKIFQQKLPPGSPIVEAISKQMGMVAQLHCIIKELKVCDRQEVLAAWLVGGSTTASLAHRHQGVLLHEKQSVCKRWWDLAVHSVSSCT